MIKQCAWCGKTFETNQPRYINCSKECYRKYWNKRKVLKKSEEHPVLPKICVVCGEEFQPTRNSIQVTCSEECRKIHKKRLELKRGKRQYISRAEWNDVQRQRGAIQKEKTKKQREEKKEAEREAKKRECECVWCGEKFKTIYPKQVFCSVKCQKKSEHKRADKRLVGKTVDNDITLEKLYKKEKGICYLCGGKCDWNDKTVLENGQIITGKKYPSIEHVVPLSKGGLHSWDNVRLACRLCNTKKGASVPEWAAQQFALDIKKEISDKGKLTAQFEKATKRLVAIYASASEASRRTGIPVKSIQNCARGQNISCHGYLWEYLN